MIFTFKALSSGLLGILLLANTLVPVCAQNYYFNTIASAQGLSHSSVFCITQDHKGFMWFGTREGLSRYDSQRIKTYDFDSSSPTVETSRINDIEAVGADLYVGTGVGLLQYNSTKDEFEKVPLIKNADVFVNDITAAQGEVLVGTNNGLYFLNKDHPVKQILPNQNIRKLVEYRRDVWMILIGNALRLVTRNGESILEISTKNLPNSPYFETLYKDKDGAIWAGTDQGLLVFDPGAMQFARPDWFPESGVLVRTIVQDHRRQLWVGTEKGAYRYAKTTGQLSHYNQSFDRSPNHLADQSIYCSFVSAEGIVWLGSYFGGVNYALPEGQSFNYLFPERNARTLAGKAVSQIVSDADQNLWVATEDGGVTVFDQNLVFQKTYDTRNGLKSNNVHALFPEANGTVWIGTFSGGLSRLHTRTGTIKTFTKNPKDANSLSNDRVYAIHKDRQQRVWVGTQKGLNLFDEKKQAFTLVFPAELGHEFIYAIHQDRKGNLWFATRNQGIYRCDSLRQNLSHFTAQTDSALRSNQVISISEDRAGNLWFGTLGGKVACFDYRQQKFVELDFLNQFPDQTIYGVLEDDQSNLWFSSNRGLLEYDVKSKNIRVFDRGSGLLTTQFNFKSLYKNRAGTLFFGSVNGLCYFQPKVLRSNIYTPKCYFTGLKIFNEEVVPGKEKVLKNILDETRELTIEHSQNVLTLDFVALNYLANGNHAYTYYLEGFEKTWNAKTDKSSATFTNLPFGTYTFHLKSYKSDGTLSEDERALRITVKPPLWLSPLAILLYLAVIAVAIYYYGRFVRFMNEQKLAVQMERLEKEKSSELHQQKINFFTFISSEFKAPLTVIVAVIDEIIHAEPLRKEDLNRHVKIIKKNARHLQLLIEQLTAIRKTSEGTSNKIEKIDLVGFVKENLLALKPVVEANKLAISTTFSQPYVNAYLDSTQLELILAHLFFTLYSNCKPESTFEIGTDIEPRNDASAESIFHLTITGPIPEALLKTLPQGTGLPTESSEVSPSISGSLMSSLVADLRGEFRFESGEKPILYLAIPYAVRAGATHSGSAKVLRFEKSVVESLVADFTTEPTNPTIEPTPPDNEKAKILIAGKNIELLRFLRRHFGDRYEAMTAANYAKANKKTDHALPDLILCDADLVNEKDENFCQSLKANVRTSFIPVILMLENDSEQSRLTALSAGSDAMIGKPFTLQELDLLVKNTLASRRLMREKYMGSALPALETATFQNNKSTDFLLRFTDLIEKKYADSTLTVDLLADSMECSRSSLHTKIKTLTGRSTVEFLNQYRLERARSLLTQGYSVAEAAQGVGFNDPNYFSRSFKRKYGTKPSEIRPVMSQS